MLVVQCVCLCVLSSSCASFKPCLSSSVQCVCLCVLSSILLVEARQLLLPYIIYITHVCQLMQRNFIFFFHFGLVHAMRSNGPHQQISSLVLFFVRFTCQSESDICTWLPRAVLCFAACFVRSMCVFVRAYLKLCFPWALPFVRSMCVFVRAFLKLFLSSVQCGRVQRLEILSKGIIGVHRVPQALCAWRNSQERCPLMVVLS